MIDTLTGEWSGMFDYAGDMAPVHFVAHLSEHAQNIAGIIDEVEDLFDGLGPISLSAVVSGSRQGSQVEFRKVYDDVELPCAIDYHGTVDPDFTEISGEWIRLDDGATGSFVMRRSTGSAVELEREIAVERLD